MLRLRREPHTPDQATPAGADDWDLHWDRYAEAAALNPAQGFRRRLIVAALAIDEPGARILDIGSGTGDLAADLVAALPDPEVAGLELSATGVEISRRKVAAATFYECDLLANPSLPMLEGWARYATCSEVLEHVDDPAALLRRSRRMMAPGCLLVITVPGGPMSAFDRHIGHRRHFDRDSLRAVIEAAGLEPVEVRAAGFPFFNLYRLGVIAAGERLIADDADAPPSRGRRIAARVFDSLMRGNTHGRRLGWQMVAIAQNHAASA